jgi:hypothetical protein
LFLPKKTCKKHVNTTNRAFPIKITPIEKTWKNTPTYANLPNMAKTNTQKYLDKLYMYGITTIAQIQNPDTMGILTPEEFRSKYKQIPKTIKAVLQQAKILFPTPTPTALHRQHPHPPQQNPTNITHKPSTHPTFQCVNHH